MRNNFTDQKPRIATEKDCRMPYAGAKNGGRFGCYLCGTKFKAGDTWRWVYNGRGGINFLTCQECDGEDVVDRFNRLAKMVREKYWAFDPEGVAPEASDAS